MAAIRHNPQSAIRNPQSRLRRAFTLIETALVTVIVGVGVMAIMAAEQGFHQETDVSQRLGTALLLANEVRELTAGLPRVDPIYGSQYWGPEPNESDPAQYDDLDDFAGPDGTGVTISPPISAARTVIPNMTGWSQVVTAQSVLENYINGPAAPPGSTNVIRLTCRVYYQGPSDKEPQEVTSLTWVRGGS